MVGATTRARPDLRFEAGARTVQPALPRMDVAAFVGFAEAGPVDVPVAVEDVSAFRSVFGRDPQLAYDAEAARRGRGFLGPALEAFFANGGRRAWVVRVAGPATLHRVAITGLVGSDGRLAHVRARSEGSWAERVNAGFVEEAIRLLGRAFGPAPSGAWQLRGAVGDTAVRAGDLLRLSFGDVMAYFPVATATVEAGTWIAEASEPSTWFHLDRPLAGRVAVEAHHRHLDGETPLANLLTVSTGADGRGFALELRGPSSEALLPGDLLRLVFDDGSQALLPLDHVDVDPERGGRVSGDRAFWPVSEAGGRAAATAWLGAAPMRHPTVDRVQLALVATHLDLGTTTLRDLGLTARHPRYWATLPSDARFFGRPEARLEWWSPPEGGRFAFAGPSATAAYTYPLRSPSLPSDAIHRGPASPAPASRDLERDGLTRLTAALFVDPRLAGESETTLASMVQSILLRTHAVPPPVEPVLRGLHALWPIEEVSLISVPDVVQRGWAFDPPGGLEYPAPPDLAVERDPGGAPLALVWSTAPGILEYRLERADDVDFTLPVELYRGPGARYALDEDEGCARRLFYRVRAYAGHVAGGWSETEALRWPPTSFRPCGAADLEAPDLQDPTPGSPRSEYALDWSAVVGAEGYEVQESDEPGFLAGAIIHRGTVTTTLIPRGRSADRFFRVRAVLGAEPGPWSRVVRLPAAVLGTGYRFESTLEYERGTRAELVAVHRALLTFCAARGDATAVLTLPAHDDARSASLHRGRLSDALGPTGALVVPAIGTTAAAWSHGALYHPWVVSARDGALEPVPCDGHLAGLTARRAVAVGAWGAPANQVLEGVVALVPAIDRGGADRMLLAGVNALERAPRGFVPLVARTLDERPLWMDLPVVRLGILVRRVVMARGPTYVFEPHGRALRARVRDDFDRLFNRLWRLGALAGAGPGESWQVRTDARVNTARDVDAGRFIVELRYAPARPLEFLTVRLVERPNAGLTVEVI